MTSSMRISGLHVRRGASLAVNGVDFDVEFGRWTGVVGANGSGKTTMLRAISGRLPIEAGEVSIGGVVASSRLWLAERVSLAPEITALPAALTGDEILGIIAENAPAPAERLIELRSALEIDRLAYRRIGSMSAGMRQRIAIFAAFAAASEIVVLDEPFNWLDPVCAHDVKSALSNLVAKGELTLVTALHDISTLTLHCHHGVLLADGLVARVLSGDELDDGRRDIGSFERKMIADLRLRQN